MLAETLVQGVAAHESPWVRVCRVCGVYRVCGWLAERIMGLAFPRAQAQRMQRMMALAVVASDDEGDDAHDDSTSTSTSTHSSAHDEHVRVWHWTKSCRHLLCLVDTCFGMLFDITHRGILKCEVECWH